MATSIFSPELNQVVKEARDAAIAGKPKTVTVNGVPTQVTFPYQSPADWRDCWIYFLMLDRFNNPDKAPKGTWNQRYGYRQGGTFNGVTNKLDYIQNLGARAIWLSPPLKNSMPDDWEYNYHGYGIQDFLNLDPRFASDGTVATAE